MLALVGYFIAAFLIVVVVFGIGAAIYELYIVKHDKLDDRDYTRSYDWTTSDH